MSEKLNLRVELQSKNMLPEEVDEDGIPTAQSNMQALHEKMDEFSEGMRNLTIQQVKLKGDAQEENIRLKRFIHDINTQITDN